MDTRLIWLTVPEVQFAMAMAIQRDACKRNRDKRTSQTHSGFGVHFGGAVGEVCHRKLRGGTLNLNILPDGDDHKPDTTLPDGREVEIKSSLYTGKNVELKFRPDELGRFQNCTLVQVTLPDRGLVFPVWSWGYIKGRLQEKDYGYGLRYVFNPMQEGA